jgi:hypothetical protein
MVDGEGVFSLSTINYQLSTINSPTSALDKLDKIGLRFTAWRVFHILARLSSIGELQIQKEQINREAGGEGNCCPWPPVRHSE